MLLLYVAEPEKYVTPSFGLSLQEVKRSKLSSSGAPRPGWNLTFQFWSKESPGPESRVSTGGGGCLVVPIAGLRKTTKMLPYGSRRNETIVRPPSIRYKAGADRPVTASHNSGLLPCTRKVASSVSARSLRLSTK